MKTLLTTAAALWVLLAACNAPTPSARTTATRAAATPDWQMGPFTKLDAVNPILVPTTAGQLQNDPLLDSLNQWEGRNVLNPTALVRNDSVYLIYRAQDQGMTSRLGLATSADGVRFTKETAPIFYPARDSVQRYEFPGGTEDPRIVELPDGRFLMTYTGYDGKTARLMHATSPDLRTWTKHGLTLGYGKYRDRWSKSGAVVSERIGDRIVATRIDGRYWMYFGDTDLFMAHSDDGIQWTPLENAENGRLFSVLRPRPGFFDSRLVEPGPYALLTPAGVHLMYNASNAANANDPTLPKFTYAAGQALFDAARPYKLLDRSDDYFIKPDKDFERTGEVNEVVFVEGLVPFRGQWFLYYGTADSRIGVATAAQ